MGWDDVKFKAVALMLFLTACNAFKYTVKSELARYTTVLEKLVSGNISGECKGSKDELDATISVITSCARKPSSCHFIPTMTQFVNEEDDDRYSMSYGVLGPKSDQRDKGVTFYGKFSSGENLIMTTFRELTDMRDCKPAGGSFASIESCALRARVPESRDITALLVWLNSMSRIVCTDELQEQVSTGLYNALGSGNNLKQEIVMDQLKSCYNGMSACCISAVFGIEDQVSGEKRLVTNFVFVNELGGITSLHHAAPIFSSGVPQKGSITVIRSVDEKECGPGFVFLSNNIDPTDEIVDEVVDDDTGIPFRRNMIELAWIVSNDGEQIAVELEPGLTFGESEDEAEKREQKQREEEQNETRSNNRRTTIISTVSAAAAIVAAIGGVGYCCVRKNVGASGDDGTTLQK